MTLRMEAGAHTDGFDQISPEACILPECSLETSLLLKQVHRLCGSRSLRLPVSGGHVRLYRLQPPPTVPGTSSRAAAQEGTPSVREGGPSGQRLEGSPPLSQMHGPAASAFAGRQPSGALHARVHPRLRGACPASPAQRPPALRGLWARASAPASPSSAAPSHGTATPQPRGRVRGG